MWDLAQAHCLALDYLLRNKQSLQVNLGSEKGFSVQEVVSLAEQVTGKAISSRMKVRREGDPSFLVASAKRAREVLGWHMDYSDLRSCIESAWKWMQNKPGKQT